MKDWASKDYLTGRHRRESSLALLLLLAVFAFAMLLFAIAEQALVFADFVRRRMVPSSADEGIAWLCAAILLWLLFR